MKQYIGNLEDKCFFYRCQFCSIPFLIEEEKELHESRCNAVNKLEAQEIMRKLPNIEEECC